MPNDMTPMAMDEAFTLTSFLEGRTRAWGIFEDRFGRVRRRFEVEMNGHWQGDVFILDEDFVYDDGRSEHRTWQVYPSGDNSFTATCPDCIGKAKGSQVEGSIRMAYAFRLRLPSREIIVDFDDRLYRIDDRRAVNRATMRKWGVKLGELSLFFERVSQSPPRL